MSQSKMIPMLLELQKDLNNITVCAISANSSITDVLSLYSDGTQHYTCIPLYASRMSSSLQKLLDAFEKFMNDADELSRYLDAKG